MIIVDALFGSVACMIALHSMLGLYMMGVVKTASSRFPKKFLTQWGSTALRESHTLLHSTYQKTVPERLTSRGLPDADPHYPMYALGWKDRKGLMYVINVGLRVACEPYKRPRSRKILPEDGRRWVTSLSNREVACSEAIKTFYTYFGAVDHHDHLRQGTLAFHKHWPT